tara:strand:+ start:1101 stop:1274 length:174 start_codon:yes stop_codon:yes gene_type:complete
MTTIAILGFFSLIIAFFYLGRNDFGLKPTVIANDKNSMVDFDESAKSIKANLEESKS